MQGGMGTLVEPVLEDNDSVRRSVRAAPSRYILRVQLYALLALLDMLCIAASFAVGWLVRFGDLDQQVWFDFGMAMVPLYMGLAFNGGAYSVDALKSPTTGAARALGALVLAVGLLLFIAYFLKVDLRISRLAMGSAILLSFVTVATMRKVAGEIICRRLDGRFVTEVVIGDGAPARIPHGTTYVDAGEVGIVPDARNPIMLQRLAALLDGADRVVVACRRDTSRAWAMLLKGANIRGEVLATEFDAVGAIGVASLMGQTTLIIATGPLNLRQRMLKRGLDLAFAIPALIALAPVLLLTAVAIKLDSRGPVFFKQQRVGRGNALFEVFKFRSMRVEATDFVGQLSTRREDDRVTRVGRFLRRTSIDELPQLLNVLFGTMSIVGPRPHALGSMAGQQLFWEVDERYWHRHALKPGITGLAQVRGLRGATHERDDLTRRLQSDLEYLSGWSIWGDLLIILSTLRVIVHSRAF